MKKLLRTLLLALCGTASFVSAEACTNFIVTRGASTDGSVMVSYAADSHWLYGALYHTPAGRHRAGAELPVYDWDSGRFLRNIPQAAETFNTIGNMNEHSLIIAETTYGGRPELADTTGGIDYGSLIYITLQRARTAREAIRTIVELADTYGYASGGESFSIADRDEAWIMELIGKGFADDGRGGNARRGIVWVARRIPDGYVSGHANQARIATFPLDDSENCLYAPDVVSFAKWATTRVPTPNSASATPTRRSNSARCAAAKPACGLSSAPWPTAWSATRITPWAAAPPTACPCG